MEKRKTLYQPLKMGHFESLDFKVFDNLPLRQYYSQINKSKIMKAKIIIAKWFIYFLVGILLGSLARGIKKSVDILQEFKLHTVEKVINEHNFVAGFFSYYGIVLMYGIIGCSITLLCGPMSAGSGIPEIKGYLNGVKIEGTINLKTFIGKIISIIFSYSSSLALGPEGPMVHIGSIIGGGLGAAKSRMLHIRLPDLFEKLRTDREQRDFISSGAAAGIAAAFGAPIGGVLYAIEEATSFWSRELTWRTFFGCMIATFTVNIISKIILTGDSVINDYGLLSFGMSRDSLYNYQELLPFCLIGIIGGLLGGLFVKLNVRINQWRRDKLSKKGKFFKILEIIIIITLSSILYFCVSLAGGCRGLNTIRFRNNVCDNIAANSTQPISLFCKEGEYNPLVNLFLIPQDKALRLLFSRTSNIFNIPVLIAFLMVYFTFVIIVSGASIAAGLFVPTMLIGAAFGRLIGILVSVMFPDAEIDDSIYALVGSAAMMAGFSRLTITVCVIIVELTMNTQFLLPIMFAVIFAKWVGDTLSFSLNEELMQLKSIIYLDHHPPKYTFLMNIKDIMANDVICINEVESLDRIVDILQTCQHNGFPVILNEGEERQHTYSGFILRKQLLLMIDQQLFFDKNRNTMIPTLDYDTYVTIWNKKLTLETVSRSLPSKEQMKHLIMDVRPYMDRSHVVIQDSFSFINAYRLFQTEGLRHLPVVNKNFQVVGIVTRHDLLIFNDNRFVLKPNQDDDEELSFGSIYDFHHNQHDNNHSMVEIENI